MGGVDWFIPFNINPPPPLLRAREIWGREVGQRSSEECKNLGLDHHRQYVTSTKSEEGEAL